MPRKALSKKSAKPEVAKLSFDDAQLVKDLLAGVSDRAREVLTLRFGLGASKRETLESIGERWGVTRERVRQVEAAGIEAIRFSRAFKEASGAFEELTRFIESLGSIVPEDHLLEQLASDEKSRNRFRFLLVVGSQFIRERETEHFYARWHIDHATAKRVHNALHSLYSSLEDDEVLPEAELFERFLSELKDVNTAYRNEQILSRWLSISKVLKKNPLSEWGKSHAPAIRTKGVRDYAYLVIRARKEPMHFREVATAISELFGKKAHVATTHNELMKDSRFVLVGRGLYALSEWGYTPGVVRDVIRDILKGRALTREQVLAEVKKKRFVKDNTVLVNLNDTRYFKRGPSGTYTLA